MTTLALIKLLLTGFAIVAILYVCITGGVFDKSNDNFWENLPRPKKILFACGIAATLLQTFL